MFWYCDGIASLLKQAVTVLSHIYDFTFGRLQSLVGAFDLLVFGYLCHATRVASALLMGADGFCRDSRLFAPIMHSARPENFLQVILRAPVVRGGILLCPRLLAVCLGTFVILKLNLDAVFRSSAIVFIVGRPLREELLRVWVPSGMLASTRTATPQLACESGPPDAAWDARRRLIIGDAESSEEGNDAPRLAGPAGVPSEGPPLPPWSPDRLCDHFAVSSRNRPKHRQYV